VLSWRERLRTDPHAAKRELYADEAASTKMIAGSMDAWLFEQETVVHKSGRRAIPLVSERMAVGTHLLAVLQKLDSLPAAPERSGGSEDIRTSWGSSSRQLASPGANPETGAALSRGTASASDPMPTLTPTRADAGPEPAGPTYFPVGSTTPSERE